jgi:hypothetical protein
MRQAQTNPSHVLDCADDIPHAAAPREDALGSDSADPDLLQVLSKSKSDAENPRMHLGEILKHLGAWTLCVQELHDDRIGCVATCGREHHLRRVCHRDADAGLPQARD